MGINLEYRVSSGNTELLTSGELGAKVDGQKEQNIAFPHEEMTKSKGWFWLELCETESVSRARVGRAAQQHPRRVSQETGQDIALGLLRSPGSGRFEQVMSLGSRNSRQVHGGSCSTAKFVISTCCS